MEIPEMRADLEVIRKRPAMYVGSTGLFGFINYLVCPVVLLLAHGAKRIDALVTENGFEINSDAVVPVERTAEGRIAPFQELRSLGSGRSFEATVLTALSHELYVSVDTGARSEEWQFARGVLKSYTLTDTPRDARRTTLRFIPDDSIFTITEVSPAVFQSYFRRLSYLNQGIRFTVTAGEDQSAYFSENGMEDLFTSIGMCQVPERKK